MSPHAQEFTGEYRYDIGDHAIGAMYEDVPNTKHFTGDDTENALRAHQLITDDPDKYREVEDDAGVVCEGMDQMTLLGKNTLTFVMEFFSFSRKKKDSHRVFFFFQSLQMAYNRIDMIRLAIVASNYVAVSATTQKGTEFLVHSILTELARQLGPSGDIAPTVFASGDSVVPFPLVSVDGEATIENPALTSNDRILFELALTSKAFAQADQFDIYHVHISSGEFVLPFTKLIKKPVLITMYGVIPDEIGKQYLNLYKDLPNVKFVSVIDNQQRHMPLLPWAGTIPHGIDMTKYSFDPVGGQHILWAGRAVKEKGADVALDVVEQTHRPALFFPLLNPDTLDWFWQHVLDKKARLGTREDIVIRPDMKRYDMASYFSKAKLTLIPISWEEPFGLVMTESMACGTPIVAYARGSTPDIVIDGKTGFLVNETESNKRGDWIIKKTGIAGLVEAVEKIYTMPKSAYEDMRLACRTNTESRFSIEKTVKEYIKLYRNLVT